MAKKITIENVEPILNNLSDDWGGENNTQASQRIYGTEVPAGAEWGVNRGEVERFIKQKLGEADVKVGGIAISREINENNYYRLLGFKTAAQADEYRLNGSVTGQVFDVVIPISTVQADTYRATLSINRTGSSTGSPFLFKYQSEWNVGVRLNAWHLIAADNTREQVPATTRLIVERSSDGVNWYNLLSMPISSTDSENTFPTLVDLGSAINIGSDNEMRIRFSIAPFQYEDNGELKLLSAQPIVIYVKPVSLSISMPDAQWQQPKQANGTSIGLRFNLGGNATKTLHFSIDDIHNETINGIDSVGEYDVTAYDNNREGIADSGVHNIEAWVTCESIDGSELESEHIYHQIMVINASDTSGALVRRVLIQNMAESVDNFVQSEICRYMIWNPKEENGRIVNDTESLLLVRFIIANRSSLTGDYTEYLSLPVSQRGGYAVSLMATLEVEGSANDQSYNAYLHAFDESGNSMLDNAEYLSINNQGGFQPVGNSAFHLNPKTRNNGEANPRTIINERNVADSPQSSWQGFNMDESDGYVTDETGEKVLRVPAGRLLTIQYNPFAHFYESPSPSKSMTLDIDMCVRNIINEYDPILKLAEQSGNAWLGLLMRPLDGTMVSVASSTAIEETDFRWAEGRRVHVSINIVPNIKPNDGNLLYNSNVGGDPNATIDLVRVFINGVIVREIRYNKSNRTEFCTGAMSNGGIVIGQVGTNGRASGADIDIYGMRIWFDEDLTPAKVLQNYISSIPDGTKKRRIKHNNDIVVNDKISLKKVKEVGKNSMVWHGENGRMPLINDDSKKGWFEIYRYDNEGNFLPQYSGTFCKATKKLKAKGQGTTAMSYYYWNLQVKLGDVGWDDDGNLVPNECITLAPSELHSDIVLGTPVEENSAWVVPIYGGCLGKNYPLQNKTKNYPCVVENGEIVSVTLPDGWIDGNGLYRGQCWQSGPNIPFAQKLVLKINYASSMQSHLIGVNWLFNDLHTAICGENSLQAASPAGQKAVVAKHVEPVLFFVSDSTITDEQATELNAEYQGPAGMGAGKMDKPTWGYVKSLHPLFAMFEGGVNNSLLTDMLAPFDDVDHVLANGTIQPAKVKYCFHDPDNPENKDPECFYYRTTNENGANVWEKGIECDAGKLGRSVVENPVTAEDNFNNLLCNSNSCDVPEETPSVEITAKLRNAWNFIYLHNPNIGLYNGSFNTFANEYSLNFSKENRRRKWVCVTEGGSNAEDYKVKRYDFCERRWVDAGLWNETLHAYDVVDIRDIEGMDLSSSQMRDPQLVLERYIELLVEDARVGIGDYFKVSSLKFHYAFVNMFIAGTDNCSKNTYYVIDPATGKFELHQDDVDTVLATDNFGYQTKPYYIDRMNPYPEGSDKSGYDGMQNGLFDLVEAMWMNDSTHTISSMMSQVISTMINLTGGLSSAESDAMGESIWKVLNKYIFDIQRWIPQVAYNEAARVRYEFPAALGYTGREGLARPLPQSMGDQLEAEIQFMTRRLIYMASFAGCCEFSRRIGNAGASLGISDINSLFPVTIKNLPNGVAPAAAVFRVVPHQYLYPCCYQNEVTYNSYTRVAAGQEFIYAINNPAVDSDYALTLPAVNYYRSLGNIGDISTARLTLVGKRLTSFIAEPTLYYENEANGSVITAEAYNALQDKTGYLPAFQPTTIGIPDADEPTRLLEFSMKGVSTVEATEAIPFNMSRMTNIQRIDLRGTKIGRVILPKTPTLVSVALPSATTSLEVDWQPNATLTLEDASNLTSLVVRGNNIIETYQIIYSAYTNDAPLTNVVIEGVDWNNVNASVINWLVDIPSCELTGQISISDSTPVDFALRMKMLQKWGDAIQAGILTISYAQNSLNGFQIGGERYIAQVGQYQYAIVPNNTNANNFTDIEWSVAWKNTALDVLSDCVELDSSGNLLVKQVFDDPTAIITISVSVDGGTPVTYDVGLFYREAVIGDYVFANGSWSDKNNPLRTIIGYCVYSNNGKRIMVAKADVTSDCWGIYKENNNTNGFSSLSGSVGGIFSSGYSNFFEPPRNWYDEETSESFGTMNAFASYGFGNDLDWAKNRCRDVYGVDWNNDNISLGRRMTITMMLVRDRLLLDNATNINPPTTTAELNTAITNIKSSHSNQDRYRQYFYPAFSRCDLYKPAVNGEELSSKFDIHHWFLPYVVELKFYSDNKGTFSGKSGFTALANTSGAANYYWTAHSFTAQASCFSIYSNSKATTSDSNKYLTRKIRPFCEF